VDDENRAWHFERADGSFTRAGKSLFWYGVQDVKEVEAIVKGFEANKRIERAFLPVGPTPPPHRASTSVPEAPTGTRAFSTSARRPTFTASQVGIHTGRSRGYGTAAEPKRVALIGARGFTGQALVSLLNSHPSLDLKHVSSRELAGSQLPGYNKSTVTYESLGPEDVQKMEENGEVDAWVMALPNGVCKPFVDAVDRAKGKSVIVDLSADYRFENQNGWTYGLPELYSRDLIKQSKRISNPGCYATSSQLLLGPLLPYHDHTSAPTVFGISGYSGAGTKSGQLDEQGRPTTTPKVTPQGSRDAVHAEFKLDPRAG